MGARPWLPPSLLFGMIPRFPSMPGVRECATPTAAAHASTGRAGPRPSSPTHTTTQRRIAGRLPTVPTTTPPESTTPETRTLSQTY